MDNINEIKKLLAGKGNNSFVFKGKAVEEIWEILVSQEELNLIMT